MAQLYKHDDGTWDLSKEVVLQYLRLRVQVYMHKMRRALLQQALLQYTQRYKVFEVRGLLSDQKPQNSLATSFDFSKIKMDRKSKDTQYEDDADDLISDEETFTVEKIIRCKYHKLKKQVLYYVKWKGYPDTDNTWEPREHFSLAFEDQLDEAERKCLKPQYWTRKQTTLEKQESKKKAVSIMETILPTPYQKSKVRLQKTPHPKQSANVPKVPKSEPPKPKASPLPPKTKITPKAPKSAPVRLPAKRVAEKPTESQPQKRQKIVPVENISHPSPLRPRKLENSLGSRSEGLSIETSKGINVIPKPVKGNIKLDKVAKIICPIIEDQQLSLAVLFKMRPDGTLPLPKNYKYSTVKKWAKKKLGEFLVELDPKFQQ